MRFVESGFLRSNVTSKQLCILQLGGAKSTELTVGELVGNLMVEKIFYTTTDHMGHDGPHPDDKLHMEFRCLCCGRSLYLCDDEETFSQSTLAREIIFQLTKKRRRWKNPSSGEACCMKERGKRLAYKRVSILCKESHTIAHFRAAGMVDGSDRQMQYECLMCGKLNRVAIDILFALEWTKADYNKISSECYSYRFPYMKKLDGGEVVDVRCYIENNMPVIAAFSERDHHIWLYIMGRQYDGCCCEAHSDSILRARHEFENRYPLISLGGSTKDIGLRLGLVRLTPKMQEILGINAERYGIKLSTEDIAEKCQLDVAEVEADLLSKRANIDLLLSLYASSF
ncbi:hypothetical protein FWC63_01750 [Candidatus Saccharibacteria bacterium]|nr:hypothetical protein [Candidatus Saccharibacteria bacterium]